MRKVSVIRYKVLTLRDIKLYTMSSVFVLANVLLPQIFHQFGIAGRIFLPLIGNTYILITTSSLKLSFEDVFIGYPGLILQILAVPAVVRFLQRNED